MNKLIFFILTLILVSLIIWDLLLFKVYNKVEHTRTTLMMENMYNKNDIVSEIQGISSLIY